MTEWVEVQGKTVKDAVAAGLAELGLDSPDAAEIEVLEEPERGFLGIGGRLALVRIKAKPKRRRRRRGRGKGKNGKNGKEGRRSDGPSKDRRRSQPSPPGNRAGDQTSGGGGKRPRRPAAKAAPAEEKETAVNIEEQAQVVQEFLEGLLEAFGLDGGVEVRTEEDIIFADLSGDQTEALIGPKGSVMQAVLELTRTVVHRKTQAGARLRLDIGGYAERRREALRIYVGRLAEQVKEEGGEVMLEPMNPADRKVVHDAVAEIDGVRSYSEGEEPERSVVVAAEE